ncbi:hypothetical protein T10_5228, partial [Trichinella papuae]
LHSLTCPSSSMNPVGQWLKKEKDTLVQMDCKKPDIGDFGKSSSTGSIRASLAGQVRLNSLMSVYSLSTLACILSPFHLLVFHTSGRLWTRLHTSSRTATYWCRISMCHSMWTLTSRSAAKSKSGVLSWAFKWLYSRASALRTCNRIYEGNLIKGTSA